MFKNLFNRWLKAIAEILEDPNDEFQGWTHGTYDIHYLVDCGAGYMGGKCSVDALSIEHAIETSGIKKYDIECIYFREQLVWKASWSDTKDYLVDIIKISR